MEVNLLKPRRANLSITFNLAPFITDWASAQTKFTAAITRQFGYLLAVRPQDFSLSPSIELGELRFRYRIFGGPSTIVLSPDTLQLNFVSLNENDNTTVIEIVRGSVNVLLKDIGGYTRDNVSLTSNIHVEVVSDEKADVYLDQFALKQPADVVEADLDIKYWPVVSFGLSDKKKNWVLHRSVEKSELLDNGLFVTTNIFISSPSGVMTFEDQKQLVDRISNLADQAIGLKYPE